MRLGLLGPSGGDTDALDTAARFLVEGKGADRVVYLGVDGALDAVVTRWAQELVGGDASDGALWDRAAQTCADADPAAIAAFVAGERQRLRLRSLESLHDEQTRGLELLAGRVVVLIHDKGHFDEEDMIPANLLVYGKAQKPVVKPIGNRWFLSPGSLEHAGVIVLDETEDGIELELFDATGKSLQRTPLATQRSAKLRISTA